MHRTSIDRRADRQGRRAQASIAMNAFPNQRRTHLAAPATQEFDMTTFARSLIACALFAVATTAAAGTRVQGNGWTKESAARAAEQRAMQVARDKGTCEITRADLSRCKRESDGTWTCFATADNHGNSCNKRR
jgi:hypothetical protein